METQYDESAKGTTRVILQKPKRIDYKAKYFTLRGYALIGAIFAAAVIFGLLMRGVFKGS